MIYVFHGEDTDASYARLKQLQENYPKHQKLKLTKENTWDEAYLAIFSEDIFSSDKFIVCENFIKTKKLSDPKILKSIPEEKIVVFRENAKLTPAQAIKFAKLAHVEEFKPPSELFAFLDSISPNSTFSIKAFIKLSPTTKQGLLWQITFRLLLLTLAKARYSSQLASKVAGRMILDWQWQKLQRQAGEFTQKELAAFFSGTQKADYMIKTGATNLTEEAIIPFLMMKYLRD